MKSRTEQIRYAKNYKSIRLNKGWRALHRIVPSDLADNILKLIAVHKASNWDVWQAMENLTKVELKD